MASHRKLSARKYSITLLILSILFIFTDIIIWNNYIWIGGLGPNPEVKLYEKEYDSGYGYLKVSLGTRTGFVAIQEMITYNYYPQIVTCRCEIFSSGEVKPSGLQQIYLRIYCNGKYMEFFSVYSSNTIIVFSKQMDVTLLDNISISGTANIEFDAQGTYISEEIPFNISYEVFEPSWFESIGFYLIILVESIILIGIIIIIYTIRTNRPKSNSLHS
jgi:hypothetical protein